MSRTLPPNGAGLVGICTAALLGSLVLLSGCVPGEEDWLPSDAEVALALGQPEEALAGERSAFVEDSRASLMAPQPVVEAAPKAPSSDGLYGPDALSFSFSQGTRGFVHDFANFAPSQFAFLDSQGGLAADPFAAEESLAATYRVQANTARLDRPLSLLLKRPVGPNEGLLPSSQYVLDFYITLTSDVPLDCIPSGAAGPQAVLKAGAVNVPPARELDAQSGLYRHSFDDGPFARSSTALSTGFDTLRSCEQLSAQGYDEVYRISHRYPVTTTPDGQMWILVGVEIAPQEAPTELFFSQIDVVVRPTRSSDARLESGS